MLFSHNEHKWGPKFTEEKYILRLEISFLKTETRWFILIVSQAPTSTLMIDQ